MGKTPVCNECGRGGDAQLVNGDKIYPHRVDLYLRRYWLCPCGAYCGSHKKTSSPLGTMAGPKTRRARKIAHAWLGRLCNSQHTRSRAYKWLSKALGIPREKCHIGMMSEKMAYEVVKVCRQKMEGV